MPGKVVLSESRNPPLQQGEGVMPALPRAPTPSLVAPRGCGLSFCLTFDSFT